MFVSQAAQKEAYLVEVGVGLFEEASELLVVFWGER